MKEALCCPYVLDPISLGFASFCRFSLAFLSLLLVPLLSPPSSLRLGLAILGGLLISIGAYAGQVGAVALPCLPPK